MSFVCFVLAFLESTRRRRAGQGEVYAFLLVFSSRRHDGPGSKCGSRFRYKWGWTEDARAPESMDRDRRRLHCVYDGCLLPRKTRTIVPFTNSDNRPAYCRVPPAVCACSALQARLPFFPDQLRTQQYLPYLSTRVMFRSNPLRRH